MVFVAMNNIAKDQKLQTDIYFGWDDEHLTEDPIVIGKNTNYAINADLRLSIKNKVLGDGCEDAQDQAQS